MAVYNNGVLVPIAPAAHEGTHVSGGSDDIDSALATAAIPNLATSKITSTRFPVDRLPAMTDERIWKGTGGNVEEIAVPEGKSIATGSYAGNDGVNRQITTGFKCSLVIVFESVAPEHAHIIIPDRAIALTGGGTVLTGGTMLHATDGFVQDSDDTNNISGRTYYYWAISE